MKIKNNDSPRLEGILDYAINIMDLMQDKIDGLISYAGGTGGYGEYRDSIEELRNLLISSTQSINITKIEPVAWKYRERIYRTSLGMIWTDKIEPEKPDEEELEVKELTPLYTFADMNGIKDLQSENEQLKEEIIRLQALLKSPWFDKTK